MSKRNPLNLSSTHEPDESSFRQMVDASARTLAAQPQEQSASQIQYFKPADFKKLQETYEKMDEYNSSLYKLLRVTAQTEEDKKLLKMLTEEVFELLRIEMRKFTVLWTQRTAGFLGTDDEVSDIYKLLIDELKAFATIAKPAKRKTLDIVVKGLKHILDWLISEAFAYSVGDISQTTHPELYTLERTRLVSTAGLEYMANRQAGFMSRLKKKIPYARSRSQSEDNLSALQNLPGSAYLE